MKLFLTAMGGSLFPTTKEAADYLAKQEGKEVLCEVKRPRNVQHHRKFFALCGFLSEHSDYTTDQIVDILKLRTGLTTTSQLSDGTLVQHPGSISFAKCGQDEFDEFYNRALDVVAADIIPGVARADLQRELMAFME